MREKILGAHALMLRHGVDSGTDFGHIVANSVRA